VIEYRYCTQVGVESKFGGEMRRNSGSWPAKQGFGLGFVWLPRYLRFCSLYVMKWNRLSHV
jgi:hypothetical protein